MGWYEDMLSGRATGNAYKPTPKKKPAPKASSTYNSQVPVASKPNYTYVPPQTRRSVTPPSVVQQQVPVAGQREMGYTPRSGQVWWESNNPGYSPPGTSGNSSRTSITSGGGGGGSSSGGGSSGGGGGGGGGGGSSVPAPVIKPPPPPAPTAPAEPTAPKNPEVWDVMTVPDPMSQAGYQMNINDLDTSWKSFLRQQTDELGAKNKGYYGTLEDLGWTGGDKGKDVNDVLDDTGGDWQVRGGHGSFANSFLANENDFGARGMSDSGIYQDAMQNMIDDYNRRRTEMTGEYTDWSQGQGTKKEQAKNTDTSNRLKAKNEAIATLASKYGVDDTMIGWGTGDEGTKFKRRTDSGAEKDQAKWAKSGLGQGAVDLDSLNKFKESKAYKEYLQKQSDYDTALAQYKKDKKKWDEQYG